MKMRRLKVNEETHKPDWRATRDMSKFKCDAIPGNLHTDYDSESAESGYANKSKWKS